MNTPREQAHGLQSIVAAPDACGISAHLGALGHVVLAVNRAPDLGSAMREVLLATIEVLDFDGGGIYIIDGDPAKATVHYHHFLPADFVDSVGTVNTGEAPYKTVFLQKEALFLEHYDRLAPERAERWGFKSVASVPMIHDSVVVGALNVVSRDRHTFSEDEKTLLTAVGRELGFTVAKARAEEQLRASEASLSDFLDQAPDLFVVMQQDGHVLYTNPAVETALGYSEAESMTMNVLDLHPPEYREAAQAVFAEMLADATVTCPLPLLAKDGRHVPVQTRVSRGVWYGHNVFFGASRPHDAERAVTLVTRTLAEVSAILDPYTAQHGDRVKVLVGLIADQLGIASDERKVLLTAAAVHDIGKVAIPPSILTKPGPLHDAEMAMVRTHAEVGAQILSHLEVMGPIADLVGQHHERLDGSGYPKGLSGDEILPGARIIAVADVVEAISSHRPYRPALGTKSAICEIVRLRGAAFDADVVDACLRVYELGGLDFLSA